MVNGPTVVTADPKQVEGLPPNVKEALRDRLKPALVKDPFYGDRITRNLWPERFRDYPNLFRFELPKSHRGVYTVLTHPGRDREVRILWLGNHKKYDRLFGYSTS